MALTTFEKLKNWLFRRNSSVNLVQTNNAASTFRNLDSKEKAGFNYYFWETSHLPLKGFEKWEREVSSYRNVDADIPTDLKRWIKLASRSGYVREESLRSLAGAAPNSFLLAIAVRRINDWVPQVQDTAREIVPKLFLASKSQDVVEALSVTIATWGSWKRVSGSDKLKLIEAVNEPELIEHFKRHILSSTSGPTSQLLSQLGQICGLDKDLEEIAKNAIQPSVRAKAYRSMLEGSISWVEGRKWKWTDHAYCKGRFFPIIGKRELSTAHPFIGILELSASDKSSAVRRVAAEQLIRRIEVYGKELMPLATRLASDNSYVVSYRGKFALTKLDNLGVEH